MPRKVFYWEGAVALEAAEEFKDCQKQIEALLNADYRTADLDTKQLRGYKLYTSRINDTHRLLFTTIQIDNKPHLLLLEVIKNHDYQKSKYLKNPALIKKFIDAEFSADLTPMETITDAFFRETQAPNLNTTEEEKQTPIDFSPAHYYQERYIVLNPSQTEAQQAPLPKIISGPAGSGKSCVALNILQHQLSLQSPEEKAEFYYVAQNPDLVKRMESTWQEFPQASKASGSRVFFRSYEQWLADLVPNYLQKRVHRDEFYSWYENQKKDQIKELSKDLVYQEFHVCSAAANEESYLNVGRKNSLLGQGNEEAMPKTYALYQKYLKYLAANDLINPDFYILPETQTSGVTVLDEAQDLPPVALANLARLSQRKIAYCLDTHQSLISNKSNLPFLENLIGKKNHIRLPLSYRSGKNIITLANGLIQLKNKLVGGTAVKDEISEIQVPQNSSLPAGAIKWLETKNEDAAEINKIKGEYKEIEVAVVAPAEYFEEARKRFNNPLVFTLVYTPEQIKGLEYKLIIAYRPLDLPIFTKANIKLRIPSTQAKTITSRAKGESDDCYGPPFNQLFTVVTRAIERLLIIQDKNHRNEVLAMEINSLVPKEDAQPSPQPAPKAKETTAQEWLKHVESLTRAGTYVQAQDIYITRLGKTPQEYLVYKAELLGTGKTPVVKESKAPTEEKSVQPELSLNSNINTSVSVSQTQTSTSTKKPSDKKIQAYVDQLAPILTSKNIANLFQKKGLLNDVLFKYKTSSGDTIFELLIKKHLKKFLLFIERESNIEYIDDINSKLLAESLRQKQLLTALLRDPKTHQTNPTGIDFLSYLIQFHFSFANELTPSDLFLLSAMPEPDSNNNSAVIFSSGLLGERVFGCLYRLLVTTPTGREALNHLRIVNSSLFNAMPEQEFYTSTPKLVEDDQGQKFLNSTLNEHPEYLAPLLERYIRISKAKHLFTFNPQLFKLLTAKILGICGLDEDGLIQGANLLETLIEDPSTCQGLLQRFEEEKSLAQEITRDTFSTKLPISQIICNLALHSIGRKLLNIFLGSPGASAFKISADQLKSCSLILAKDPEQGRPILAKFAAANLGLNKIVNLVEENTWNSIRSGLIETLDSVFKEADNNILSSLLLKPSNFDGIPYQPLVELLATPKEFLTLLKNNENKIKFIHERQLLKLLLERPDTWLERTYFDSLFESEESLEILFLFVKNIPVFTLSLGHYLKAIENRTGQKGTKTPFMCLAYNAKIGHKILNNVQTVFPSLASQLSERTFTGNMMALRALTSTKAGKYFLSLISEANPSLKEFIDRDIEYWNNPEVENIHRLFPSSENTMTQTNDTADLKTELKADIRIENGSITSSFTMSG